jgi:hypothetical protein
MAVAIVASGLALSTAASGQQPVGELFATDASVRGSMVMASGGTHVMSGSQVSAGSTVAVLRLSRGGNVRVCKGTSVAVSEASPNSPMLFGINTGALELHYTLTAIADSVVTPDFRIQLTGPGAFHVALGADAKGNTCVRTLEGNTSAVIVQEMFGGGTYQVAPGHSVKIAAGKLENATESDEACGCPEEKPAPVAVTKEVLVPVAPPEKPSNPPAGVEMDAPLVFKGSSPIHETTDMELRRESYTIATVRVVPLKVTTALLPQGMTVEKKQKAESKGGFWKFFKKLFGG